MFKNFKNVKCFQNRGVFIFDFKYFPTATHADYSDKHPLRRGSANMKENAAHSLLKGA